MNVPEVIGTIGSLTMTDLPVWCDLRVMPQGKAFVTSEKVGVVWAGLQQGLFYHE